jgi:hypothetical protein
MKGQRPLTDGFLHLKLLLPDLLHKNITVSDFVSLVVLIDNLALNPLYRHIRFNLNISSFLLVISAIELA